MQPTPQATVRHFDPITRSGSVLLDDGNEIHFDGAAFDRGGLLRLRLGQRVRLLVRGRGSAMSVVALTIVTLPFPPGLDPPGMDQPGMDQPAGDQPGLDQPGMDQPAGDQPID